MRTKLVAALMCCLMASLWANAQTENKKEKNGLVYHLNESGDHYVKLTFLNQIWVRYNDSNPGTTVDGTEKSSTFDIGLRRTRIQLFGQLTDNIFFYTQFGQNNLGYNSTRKQGLFFLDAIGEYKVANEHLSIGGGLTGWSGLSRYASPSIGALLSTDAPLYQQTTNDVNDQFLRKLSIYAKGKLGKLDYRLALSTPMSISKSSVQNEVITDNSLFSNEPANPMIHGYFMYQFMDQESNLTPYNKGTYLGTKKVFNIGAGFVTQKDAMWHLDNADTVRENLGMFAVDVFYDAPLNTQKGNAITAYACYSSTDYGKDYVRNIGVMNPANGVNENGTFNGAGDALPLIGTGNTFYAQVGYLFKRDLLGNAGTLQPYATTQYSNFDLLEDPMVMYEAGVNWYIKNQNAKLSLHYQSRPIFELDNAGNYISDTRKGMTVMQFQISI